MGEGYHNYHHEFQYDYRNGVKPWQWDPTKWMIWSLNKIGLVRNLRTVSEDRILKAQVAEQQRRIEDKLAQHTTPMGETLTAMLHAAQQRMHEAYVAWEHALEQWRIAAERRHEHSRERRRALRRDLDETAACLREALRHLGRVAQP
jgi:stearoyl-CoA desaturase (delta-9 desaturase)